MKIVQFGLTLAAAVAVPTTKRLAVKSCIVVVAAVFIASWAGAARAGLLFHDTFEDGNAADGSPVTWSPHPNPVYRGEYRVENGEYVISASGFAGVANTEGLVASDVSVRTLMRMTGTRGGGETSLFTRVGLTLHNETAYQGGIHSDGRVYLGWNDPVFHYLGQVQTDLRPLNESVLLQLDVFGNDLRFYAWRLGEDKPHVPLLAATDSRYTSGFIGLLHFPQTSDHESRFEFVQAANMPIPEPSTLTYVGIGAVAFLWAFHRSGIRQLPSGWPW